MRLADLFSCAGGTGRGYQRAGFHVTGFDIDPQPRYGGDAFEQRDVLSLTPEELRSRFDAIHASPPCQGYTEMRAPGQRGAPRLIAPVRRLLLASGLPYVIENVEGAEGEMLNPFTLCGSMFGLGCEGEGRHIFQLRRHRLFETSWPVRRVPECRHSEPVVGVYGGHARNRSAAFGGRGTKDVWPRGHKAAMSEAMGIDWMTTAELSEAIPPAYTEWLGRELMRHLKEIG